MVGYFNCSFNRLKNLIYCTKIINDDFDSSHNNLSSLEGCPKIFGNFYCDSNKIVNLEYIDLSGDTLWILLNPVYHIYKLFNDPSKIDLFNDYDCIRIENDEPCIIIDRLNDFLEENGLPSVEKVGIYKNI